MKKEELTWKALKSLHEIYEQGFTNYKNLSQFPEAKFLIEQTNQLEETRKGIEKTKDSFDRFYEKEYLLQYQDFISFLSKIDFVDKADNISVYNVKVLKKIELEKSEILSIKDLTIKELSSKYFKNSKEVKEDSIINKAICQILGKDRFTKEQQYIKILHSLKNKKAILLCENENQLNKNRKEYIEIWVAGGYNTPKLDFLPIPDVPIFYLCDWDNDGMTIYKKVKARISQIELIIPSNYAQLAKSIDESSHESKWKNNFDVSFLPNSTAIEIINFLIKNNSWIEEESIDISYFFDSF